MKRLIGLAIAAAAAGCDAADVRVQELPPAERPSPEARAGLPEVAGVWRFAGWELAPDDTARLESDLPGFGELRLETQRMDSVAGQYVVNGSRMDLVGEVRRDSVVSLAGSGGFLAGRVQRDTLWLSLTSILEQGSWPGDARAAFVRSQVASPFVRLEGARPALAAADSVAIDSARIAAGEGADTAVAPRVGEPAEPRRGEAAAPQPAEPRRAEPRPQPQEPRRAEPAEPPQQEPEAPTPTPPTPEPAEPEPEPSPPEEERRRPRLLGEPVRTDTLTTPGAARLR